MSNLIGVINYGISGNIHSIKKAIIKAGGEVVIVNTAKDMETVDKLVIPGVGSFKDGMLELEADGLIEPIKKAIAQKKHILGICLGMQVLSEVGFEYGKNDGLSILSAEVKRIECDGQIPHMGFNKLEVINKNKLLDGIEDEEFYFMHSYEMVNYKNILTLTDYCGHKFVSTVNKDNLYGVQFHPEKSREAGIKLFKNFINL
eukprot:Anaeramoba_flamelloidesa87600_49.p3 GENE.a87600_49~~a87600_49.p3  ORF type:complete len:202 (-),score=-1.76 a87600_49:1361-1966(-)